MSRSRDAGVLLNARNRSRSLCCLMNRSKRVLMSDDSVKLGSVTEGSELLRRFWSSPRGCVMGTTTLPPRLIWRNRWRISSISGGTDQVFQLICNFHAPSSSFGRRDLQSDSVDLLVVAFVEASEQSDHLSRRNHIRLLLPTDIK